MQHAGKDNIHQTEYDAYHHSGMTMAPDEEYEISLYDTGLKNMQLLFVTVHARINLNVKVGGGEERPNVIDGAGRVQLFAEMQSSDFVQQDFIKLINGTEYNDVEVFIAGEKK
jgi:hypothetical protein